MLEAEIMNINDDIDELQDKVRTASSRCLCGILRVLTCCVVFFLGGSND